MSRVCDLKPVSDFFFFFKPGTLKNTHGGILQMVMYSVTVIQGLLV